jgi:hypothetical protein
MAFRPQPATVVEDDAAGLLIAGTTTGFSGREWWGALFLFAFFAGWVASLVPVAEALVNVEAGIGLVILLAVLAIWIPMGPLIAVILVWGAVGGRETAVLDSAALVLRQAVGPFALTRAYSPRDVSDFRVLTGETVFRSGYAVAFTVNGKTIRFGNWTDRNEAEAVARALSARLAEVAPAPGAVGVIEFRPRRDWVQISFFSFWLAAWVAGGIGVQTSDEDLHGWGALALGAVWFSIAALVAMQVIIQIAGGVRASVDSGGLEIQRSLGPLRWTRRYERRAVRHLRAEPVLTEDGPAEDEFRVVFQNGRRTVRFGRRLTRAEAEAAARELNARLGS